jgi:hypothetical protein
MRGEPDDGVVDDPWARPPVRPAPEEHRPGNWGGDPAPAAPTGAGPLVSPAGRLRPARAGVVAVSVLAAIELVSSSWALWETRSVVGDEPGGSATSMDALTVGQDAIDRLNAATSLDAIVALVGGVALVVSAVLVIRWQNVVLRNQRGLGVAQPRYSPVAAGWSWFVPIWSLFGPKRAMNDAWRAAEPAGPGGVAADRWLARDVPALFAWWWAAWLVAQLLGNLLTRLTDDTLRGHTLLFAGSLVAAAATIVAGVLFVGVMERMTRRHDERIAERAAAA